MESLNEVCEHLETNRDKNRGEITCKNCGEVLEQIFSNSIWENNCNIVNYSLTSAQKLEGLATKSRSTDPFYLEAGSIFYPNEKLKYLNSLWRKRGNLLQKMDKFARENPTELVHKKELYRMVTYFSISHQILERATYLYQKYQPVFNEEKVGYHPICACLILACRENNFPLTIKQMVDFLNQRGHRIAAKGIVAVLSKLLTQLKTEHKTGDKHLYRKAEDFLPSFISKLVEANSHINTDLLLTTAQAILDRVPKEVRGAKNPVPFAIASIYASGQQLQATKRINYHLTQHYLSTFFEVAEYTLRDHWAFIQKRLI